MFRTVCDTPLWGVIVGGVFSPSGLHNARSPPLEFTLLLAISLLPFAKICTLPPLTPPLPPPRPYPPPHPLTPCWSHGARRERLAVSPTLSFTSVVALPGWFVGQIRVSIAVWLFWWWQGSFQGHRLPCLCTAGAVGVVGDFWGERPHPLSCSVVYWAPEYQMCWRLRRVVAAAALV